MNDTAKVSLEDQVRFAEGQLARSRAYWNRQLQEEKSRANPFYAAQQIRCAEAIVATLKQIAQGTLDGG